jgi:hypothetical protein
MFLQPSPVQSCLSKQEGTIKNTSGTEASLSPSAKIPSDRGVDYPLQVSRKHTLEFVNANVTIDHSKEDYRGVCVLSFDTSYINGTERFC